MPAAKKKQSIFSKINLKSPKTRGIILLVAFAIIGGGVMVFRSFAAATIWYSPATTLASATGNSACSATTIDDIDAASKNGANAKAVAQSCRTDFVSGSVVGVATWTPTLYGSSDPAVTANFYRTCASIKGVGRVKVGIFTKPHDGLYRYPGIGEFFDANPNTYQQHCSQYRQAIGNQKDITVEGYVSSDKAGNLIKIKDITIYKEINMAGPAPASPTK